MSLVRVSVVAERAWWLRWLLPAMAVILLGACASPMEPDDYRDQTPALDLRQYFDGTLDAWGMFQDRSGRIVRRFHVVIEATWEGDEGVLDEHFSYADGTTQRRVWRLTRLSDGRYEGRADDVVGVASGELAGNVLRWRYVLALPVGERVINVDFDDWMILMDERVMLNRSTMSKFGFRLGEVTLTFVRREPSPEDVSAAGNAGAP